MCFYEDGFLSTAVRSNEVPYSFISYEVKVQKVCEYYFRLCQLSHYMIHPQSNFTKIRYDTLNMIVAKKDELGNPHYLAGVCQRDRDVWVKLSLEPGTYLVLVSSYFPSILTLNRRRETLTT